MANPNQNRANSNPEKIQESSEHRTTLPANEARAEIAPEQLAAEAARVGLADQSLEIGASDTNSDHMAAGAPTTGGDIDAKQEQAKVVGEEAIGGTTPTPDQSNVDDVAAAVGINTQAEHPVKVAEEMHKRDERRHELDPESKGPAASA
jgi:hypothetical protein